MTRSKLLVAKEQEDSNGYWTGDEGASGILPIARDTGRICLAWRNKETHTGDCWGTVGGAIKSGLTPEESAVAEMKEETGYKGEIEMHPAWVFEDGDFRYFNFVGIVDSEFKLKAQKAHAWETDEIVWLTLPEILEDMEEVPEEYHPELINLFKESAKLIERFAGRNLHKRASRGVVEFPQETAMQNMEGYPEIDWSRCDLVERIPGKVSGMALLKDTRFMVDAILPDFECGYSVEEIADTYDLDRNRVEAVLQYALKHVKRSAKA